MSVDPIGSEPESHVFGQVEIEAAAHANEPGQIGLMGFRRRDIEQLEQSPEARGEGEVCRLVDAAEAGAYQECDLLPFADIKLRTCGKGVSGRFEGYGNHVRKRNQRVLRVGRSQYRSVDRLASVDRTSATDDGVPTGTEVSTQAEPWFRGDAEINVETALRQVTSRADQIVESGIDGVTVDIRLLRHRRQTNSQCKYANQRKFHIFPTSI